MNKYQRRDVSIELARVVACLIVIGCHSVLGYRDVEWDKSRLLLAMFVADGVSVYWLICGAFLFDCDNYKQLLYRTLRKVLIPLFIASATYFYFFPVISGVVEIRQAFVKSASDYQVLFKSLLAWTNGVEDFSYSWYLYVYVLLMLIFPILKPFVLELNGSDKRIITFFCMSFLFILLNDISCNSLASFSHHSINALAPAAIIT